MRGTWKFWHPEEGGPFVPVTRPHPWYVLARFGWRKGCRVSTVAASSDLLPLSEKCSKGSRSHTVPFISREGFVGCGTVQ